MVLDSRDMNPRLLRPPKICLRPKYDVYRNWNCIDIWYILRIQYSIQSCITYVPSYRHKRNASNKNKTNNRKDRNTEIATFQLIEVAWRFQDCQFFSPWDGGAWPQGGGALGVWKFFCWPSTCDFKHQTGCVWVNGWGLPSLKQT